MDFPYSIGEVLSLNGISYSQNLKAVRVSCPFCSTKKQNKDLGIDLASEVFHCYACGIRGRGGTQFHAFLHNMTTKDAYNEICSSLGITKENKAERITRPIPTYTEPSEECKEADEDVLNETYRKLNSMLSLSDKHLKDLLGRGFHEDEVRDLEYKSYIPKYDNGINPLIFEIPKKMESSGSTLKGVPGFYKTREKNVWRLPVLKPSILVPYKSYDNKIVGYQNRIDNEVLDEDENKYGWLSSNGKNEGCKISTRVHYATDFLWDAEKSSFYPNISKGFILVTEGAMKADAAHVMGGVPLLALPGISSALKALKKELIRLKAIGLKKVILAFDMDKIMNINVAEGLFNLKNIISEIGLEVEELSWSNEIVLLNGEHRKINVKSSFVFTPDSLARYVEKRQLNHVLQKAKEIGKTKIYFALKNSQDVTEENKQVFANLKKYCESKGFSCEPILWSLKLKGIDDYYAHQCRNVEYV